MAKKLHYYDIDYKYIPMRKTEYVKRGKRWLPVKSEKELISRRQAGYILDPRGLPFESSHRLEKRDRYGHNEKYDYFQSISPDKSRKSSWFVDFHSGHNNYIKNSKKYYYNKRYYNSHKKG